MKSRKRIALDEVKDTGGAVPAEPRLAVALQNTPPSDRLHPRGTSDSTTGCERPPGMERIFVLFPTPVVVLDKDLQIVSISDSSRRLCDLDLNQCRGRKFLDGYDHMLMPISHATTSKLINDAVSARKEQRSEPESGTLLPGFWHLRVLPIYEGEELLYVMVEAQDVTEEAQKTLSYSNQLSSAETYRILVSTLRDYAIFMLDPTGHIATWNTGAMLLKQYTQDEIIGRHFSTFYSEEDRKARKPQKELELALRDGKVEDEGWRVRKDGSKFWANVIITPVYRDGELTGFSKVTRDLTERKAAEARLIAAYEEASKLKSDFLANMSHEIRTPMHGMLSALALLTDTGLSKEQKELTDIIDESGAILLQVINDILDYSKLSSGSFSISKDVLNISEIVAAVRRCFNVGSNGDLRLEVDLDPRLPAFAQGDALRYRQILQNLVSNAVKFTDHGYVRVKVMLIGEDESSYDIRTEVIDTGIGVPLESDHILFTPFTQLDKFSTKRYKGTGLGLSICKSLVELMGGTIGFGPNPDQHGSIFYYTLKLNKLDARVPAPKVINTSDTDLKQLAQEKTILLVEDNVINQTIMVRLLRAFGFEKVDVAGDGQQGLQLVKQKPLTYSLILMDISMPVMDGVTATKEIRRLGHSVPIIAMTANALKGDEEAYLAEGMNDYVAKPVDRKLLTQALLRWLR